MKTMKYEYQAESNDKGLKIGGKPKEKITIPMHIIDHMTRGGKSV